MRTSGIRIHCDVVPRAGQRKATRGNSGFTVFCSSTVTMLAVVRVLVNGESILFFFRALCEPAGVDILCFKQWQSVAFH
jgi:hypothetical protein